MAGTKTYNAQTDDSLTKAWWIVDGEDQIVGRIASDIAMVLMGKHRPTYTPNVDTGDFVIITNCDKVKFSGNKLDQKVYTCLLYTSPSPRDGLLSRMPSSA